MMHRNLIYIGSSFSAKAETVMLRTAIERVGQIVTSRWMLGGHDCAEHESDPETYREISVRYGQEDMEDMSVANIGIFLVHKSSSRGRMHFEMGWMLGHGKSIAILGSPSNVFQISGIEHGYIMEFPEIGDVMADLRPLLEWLHRKENERGF